MTLYIANIDFETELAGESEKSPLADQLQFLPLLWAEEKDRVWVNALPEGSVSPVLTLDPLPLPVSSWGWSQKVAKICQKQGLAYHMPSWEAVQKVNSKLWSFKNTPCLPGANLLHNEKELELWRGSLQGKGVIKTAFGLSGRGHCFSDQENLLSICQKEWACQRAVVAEPWVERVSDFSTQWHLHEDGRVEFIALTVLENNAKGSYQSTTIGKDVQGVEAHLIEARHILKKMANEGYFGPVGMDAMFYKFQNEMFLHPIVEVNARMTMGLAAFKYRSKYFPTKTLKFYYGPAGDGLLPSKIRSKAPFKRQLYITIID